MARAAQLTADVSIVKGDANANVRPGGTLVYRVSYNNAGTAAATDVVITDTLPAHTSHLQDGAASEGWTATISDTVVVWQRSLLGSGAGGSFDVFLKVSEDAPAGARLTNHVEIATATAEDDADNNTWTTAESVVRVADVRVTKSGPAEVGSGERITYTIQYRNDGSESADDVVITDTLPAGVSYVQWDGDPATPPTVSGQHVIWQVGALPAATGGDLTLVGEVDVNQPSYSVLTNTVAIGTQTPERDLADNAATSAAAVRAGPPDSVDVLVPATVTVDSTASFNARVLDRWANPVADDTPVSFAGNALVTPDTSALTTGGVATATLSTGTEVGTATITATAGSAVGTGSLDVVPGAVGEINLTASQSVRTVGEPVALHAEVIDGYGNLVDAGVPVSFTATLGEIQPPTGNTDATGAVTATLVSTRTGTAIVSAHSAGVQDSTTVLYTPGATEQITVTAEPVVIPVDGKTSQVTASLFDTFGNLVGDDVTVTFASALGTINPMTSTTVAGRATAVLKSGRIHGQSSVTATVGTYTGTTMVEFLPADLRIQSTHEPTGEILPGTAMTYTVTYENAGTALAKGVVISNTLPDGFIDTSVATSGASVTLREDTKYAWDVEDLALGDGGTIVIRGYFDRGWDWPSSKLVANGATITSTTAEGNPNDNVTSAGNVVITADAFLQSTVDDTGTDLEPGKKIKYLVSFGNLGQATAQGVTITDTLPAHTSLWQWGEIGPDAPELTHVSDSGDAVQVWRYDGPIEGPNFGEFYVWLNIDPGAPGGEMLRNRIEIGTTTPESNDANNVEVVERRLSGVNLETLLRGPATIIPGRMITYTLRYTNTGTLPAEDVLLTNSVPAGVSVIHFSEEPDRIESDRVEWELGTVNEGQWRQIVVIGRVGTDVAAGLTLRDTVSITTTSVESYVGDNAAEANTLVVPDAPDRLTLEMDPTTVAVGTTHPLEFRVTDQYGNSIDDLTVTLTTTVGVVTPTLATTAQGMATASFEAPTAPDEGTITATFEALSDEVDVVIEPGAPAELRLEANDEELPADGASSTVIRARVADEYGNPVKDGTQVTFDTDRGSLYNGESQHTVGTIDGLASTVLHTERSPGEARVIVTTGTVSKEVVVRFLPLTKYDVYLPLLGNNHPTAP